MLRLAAFRQQGFPIVFSHRTDDSNKFSRILRQMRISSLRGVLRRELLLVVLRQQDHEGRHGRNRGCRWRFGESNARRVLLDGGVCFGLLLGRWGLLLCLLVLWEFLRIQKSFHLLMDLWILLWNLSIQIRYVSEDFYRSP